MTFVRRLSSPHGMDRPVGLHRRLDGGAGAHQHGTVDVGRHHQDAQQDGPDDGALETQVVGATCHRQAREVRVSTPEAHTRKKQIRAKKQAILCPPTTSLKF